MEFTNLEAAALKSAVESHDAQMAELSEHQLALIGGGFAVVVLG
jgi:hypothetical protein